MAARSAWRRMVSASTVGVGEDLLGESAHGLRSKPRDQVRGGQPDQHTRQQPDETAQGNSSRSCVDRSETGRSRDGISTEEWSRQLADAVNGSNDRPNTPPWCARHLSSGTKYRVTSRQHEVIVTCDFAGPNSAVCRRPNSRVESRNSRTPCRAGVADTLRQARGPISNRAGIEPGPTCGNAHCAILRIAWENQLRTDSTTPTQRVATQRGQPWPKVRHTSDPFRPSGFVWNRCRRRTPRPPRCPCDTHHEEDRKKTRTSLHFFHAQTSVDQSSNVSEDFRRSIGPRWHQHGAVSARGEFGKRFPIAGALGQHVVPQLLDLGTVTALGGKPTRFRRVKGLWTPWSKDRTQNALKQQ